MGLDTTHDCFHGAYSHFSRFRNALALAAGYKLTTIEGIPVPDVDWSKVDEEAVVEGYWKYMPGEPLLVLFMHSDCDGFIMPRHCEPLADRLEGLLPELDDDDSEDAIRFIQGLRKAAEAWEFVQFH